MPPAPPSAALAGRDAALSRVVAALTGGIGIAVVGAAGVGKTALAAAAVARLDPAAYAVTWVTATQAMQAVPFGPLGALIPWDGAPAGAAQVHRRMVEELRRRADRRVAVLVVDDAHLLDGPSAAVLLGLAGGRAARLLVTSRTGPQPDAVLALRKDRYLPALEIGPLDRSGVAEVVRTWVAGEPAGPSVDLLLQWTRGNPLFLTELVRHGVQAGYLRRSGGLWWWRSALTVPPALTELLDLRLAGLDPVSVDALTAVALGEPLALDALEAVAPGVVEDLEERALVRTEEDGHRIVVRFDLPMLAAAVRRGVTLTRRRRIASALLDATAGGGAAPALVTRAVWQLDAAGPVDAPLLLRAAQTTMHVDPELAHRFAVRAYHATPTVAAAMELAGVLVECGEPDAARTVLLHARDTASAPVERLRAAATLAGLRCWVERDPAGAAGDLAALVRHAPDAATRADLDGLRAMALLFAGRTGQALTVAGQVTIAPGDAGAPAARRGALRAALVRATALTLLGRTAEAAEVAEKLTAAAAEDAAGLSYMPGMAHAALSLAQLWRGPDEDLPLTDPVQGRRPRRPDDRTAAPDLTGLELTAWPLFDGYARRIRGDRDGAIVRLREALVQQSAGERLFRSEASAWLTITLAEAGQVDDAAEVLTHTPPDAVAVVPGLHAWAAAAVAAARGDADTAAGCMQRALAAAEASGCALVELGYLIYAAQMGGSGGPARFAGRIAQLTGQVDAPRLVAGGEAMVALAHGDGSSLLRHAVRLDTVGLHHSALVVAEAAGRRPSGGRTTHPGEAVELAGRLRRVLGLPAAGATRATLTSREAEVVDLAAAGLSDRDIAARLVLSVRTVESHLARAYRKLGVGSRRELNSRAP